MTGAQHDLDDLLMVRIRPTLCGGCGHYVGRVLLTLEPVLDDHGLQGLATASYAVCCGHMDGSNVPPDVLARTLNHLANCERHHHG